MLAAAAGIYASTGRHKGVDGRDKHGHDEGEGRVERARLVYRA
jgi:hypothetical protein